MLQLRVITTAPHFTLANKYTEAVKSKYSISYFNVQHWVFLTKIIKLFYSKKPV